MPELPEVETVRAGLAPHLTGHRVMVVEVVRADLRRSVPDDFAVRVTGRRVAAVNRRGKVLLWHLDDGATVLIHLGMSGRLGIDAPIRRHDHVRFTFETGDVVTFHDPRRFGFVDWAGPGQWMQDPLLKRLGPEPLSNSFSPADLAMTLTNRRGTIKTTLLDQAVVAGLGNIYVNEALFRARISPFRPADSLDPAEIAVLTAAIRDVLTAAVAAGGASLKDHRKPDGSQGYFQMQFLVYDQEGAACPTPGCSAKLGHGIRRVVQGGRATYYCPGCQH